jgi:NAD(P)-dependent dehydrogenase (short-subunit alcohol dehydrogenase family)
MTKTDDGRFGGKVAFVTGAGSGIGRATALAFAAEGASVVASGRSEDRIQETARLIEQQGGRSLPVQCDVTRSGDIKAALDRTIEAFGRLDVAFNNAGVEQPGAPAADITEEEWDRIIDTDLRSVFLCLKHEIPLMAAGGGGAIVNTSSGAGVIGIAGQAAYTAAKHGLIGLTKSAALDYAGAGVRINAVSPGYIDTPMMDRYTGGTTEGRRNLEREPAGRIGRAEEIASAVLWLCSDGGAFTIGHDLVVDGGQTVG